MPDLPTFVSERDSDKRLVVSEFEAALFAAAEFVDRALEPYLGLRLTKEASGLAHGELQMVSMLASVIAHRYASSGDWRERPGWNSRREQFRTALPQHYLLDVLRRTWRGPLYSLAYNRVWSSKGVPNDYYLHPPSFETWESSLQVWFEEQAAKENDRRPNVSAAEKALLKFIYGSVVTVADQARYQFDVEHLYPVQRLLNAWGRNAPAWPVGCIANLALLDDKTNRRKQTETISEYFARAPGSGGPTEQEKEQIRTWLFHDAEALAIPQDEGNDNLDLDTYRSFLDARWSRLKDALYAALNVSAP